MVKTQEGKKHWGKNDAYQRARCRRGFQLTLLEIMFFQLDFLLWTWNV